MSLISKAGYTSFVSSRAGDEFVDTTEIQNVPSSRVYIFGNDVADEIGNEDPSLEMTELRPRTRNKRSYASTKLASRNLKRTETIDREIQSSDSLQSLSLQYGCKVCDSK